MVNRLLGNFTYADLIQRQDDDSLSCRLCLGRLMGSLSGQVLLITHFITHPFPALVPTSALPFVLLPVLVLLSASYGPM